MSKRLYLKSGPVVHISYMDLLEVAQTDFYIDVSANNTSYQLAVTKEDARKLADAIISVLEPVVKL